MKAYLHIFALLTLLTLSACSNVRVSQDYSPGADFSTMQVYSWKSKEQKKTGNARIDNPLLNNRIRSTVERYLEEKGHQKTSGGSPDFYISYEYIIESKIVSEGSSFGFGVGRSTRGRHGGISLSSGGNVTERDEATLIIDFVDASTDNLVWRGSGTRRTTQHSSPEQKNLEINELVENILNQFPPVP